jgi:hypothetical protein
MGPTGVGGLGADEMRDITRGRLERRRGQEHRALLLLESFDIGPEDRRVMVTMLLLVIRVSPVRVEVLVGRASGARVAQGMVKSGLLGLVGSRVVS